MTNLLIRIESAYVVDTNALIWYLKNDKKLSLSASAVFAAAEQGRTRLILSAIVAVELFYANKKHKLFADFAKTYADVKSRAFFELVPLAADDVLDFDQDSAIPEMHDRIIAGLARRLGVPLITADPVIAAVGIVQVVW